MEPRDHTGDGLERLLVIYACEHASHLLRILFGVERLDGWLAAPGALLVDELCVRFLDVTGVCDHQTSQVSRGMRRKNIALVSLLDQVGKISRVVNVSMGEDDRVHILRLIMKI